MMIDISNLKITGKVNIKLYDEFNNVKDERYVDNTIVTTGLLYIAERIGGKDNTGAAMEAVMSHMGLGTGSAAALPAQTALITSLGNAVALSSTTVAAAPASAITYVATFGPGVFTNSAIVEAGIFNAATSGVMLCRTVFSAINKQAADTLSISWTVSVA